MIDFTQFIFVDKPLDRAKSAQVAIVVTHLDQKFLAPRQVTKYHRVAIVQATWFLEKQVDPIFKTVLCDLKMGAGWCSNKQAIRFLFPYHFLIVVEHGYLRILAQHPAQELGGLAGTYHIHIWMRIEDGTMRDPHLPQPDYSCLNHSQPLD